jgi:hypothetical protein
MTSATPRRHTEPSWTLRRQPALDEFARLEVDDGPLAQVLARLGSLVQERESARQTELKAKMIP